MSEDPAQLTGNDELWVRLYDLSLHHTVIQTALAQRLPLTETMAFLVEALLEQNEVLRKQLLIVMNELDNIGGKNALHIQR